MKAARLCLAAVLSFASLSVLADGHLLSAKELREQFADKTLTDGTHWSYLLHTDGTVDAIDMGRARKGQWHIRSRELCVRLPLNAPEDCWQVRRDQAGLWLLRDGGEPIAVTVTP